MAYDIAGLSPSITNILNNINTTTFSGDDLDLFFHCWTRPHCPACLSPSNPYPCSWCATSQTCVPNTIFPYPFGIISPIKSADICPLAWRERWEMRARPFSCRCSSMTFLSVVVAVVGTLIGLVAILLCVRLGTWAGRRWKARRQGWWKMRDWTFCWVPGFDHRKDASTETVPPAGSEVNGAAAASESTPLLA
ncbi:hypothetical protein PV04_06927 [Phialophora macrospora]|uniref:PSI domain-containing protein n=1 Tax=Phialophora macrospora TaxID=1851006 RepID=A0A0D2FLV7_9EURO|nr:hypothetical protein PV04_06927 [Phialophora macrospora]